MEIKIFRIKFASITRWLPLTANTNIGLYDNGNYSIECKCTDNLIKGTLGEEISANEFESFIRCFEKTFGVVH